MASRALVYTRGSMAEVAIECGFSDQSHFTREFRRHFGTDPPRVPGILHEGIERRRSCHKSCRC